MTYDITNKSYVCSDNHNTSIILELSAPLKDGKAMMPHVVTDCDGKFTCAKVKNGNKVLLKNCPIYQKAL